MVINSESLIIDSEKITQKIISFIQVKFSELQREGAVLGLSGGLDSAVTAALCVNALDGRHVLGLILPEKEGNPQATGDAELVARWLNIKTKTVDMTPALKAMGVYDHVLSKIPTRKLKGTATKLAYKQLEKRLGEDPFLHGLQGSKNKLIARGAAHFKVKHRMRSVLVYYTGESDNLLVVGAANKTERMTGLFCKFGIDHNADIMPIGNLYRTQVLQLAQHLHVPANIIGKPSNPDIIPGIDDKYADITGLSSDEVDLILIGLENRIEPESIAKQTDISISKVEYIRELTKRSYHMRHPSMMPDL